MVTDVQTTKVYFSSWLPKVCPKLWDVLHAVLLEKDVDYGFISGTADIWCRDYMPIQVATDEIVSYKYWPDYLVNRGLHQYITDSGLMAQNIVKEYPNIRNKHLDFIIDGGNIVKCDDEIIMTSKVFFENTDYSYSFVSGHLENAFGCEILFLPWDREEKYGHSDGIVHYLGNNQVLLTNYDDYSTAYFNCFISELEKKFEVVPLKFDVKKKSRYNWAYVNYLQIGSLILVPQLGIEEDDMAIEQIRRALPDTFDVVGIPALEAVRRGGALNCISWNIDANIARSTPIIKKLISPFRKDAFSESAIYKVLQQRLDFNLPLQMWNHINEAFAIYWNEEVGVGNLFGYDDMFWSIKRQLAANHILLPDEQLYRIIKEISNYIDSIPGVVLHE